MVFFENVTQVHGEIAKEAFNHVHPRTEGRVEMHVKALVLLKPRLHFWMLVRGIVVDDQMQLAKVATPLKPVGHNGTLRITTALF